MAMTDFTIIRRSLTARLFSTVITTLIVATAVGLMIVLLILPAAGFQAFQRGNGNMHFLVSGEPSPLQSVLNGVFYQEAPGNTIKWPTYEHIVQRFRKLEYAIPIQQGDSYQGYPVLASTEEFFSRFKPGLDRDWSFADGAAYDGTFDVVAGATVARELGLVVGQELILTHGTSGSRGGTSSEDASEGEATSDADHHHEDFHYTVVGILELTGGPHDRALFTDLDAAWIIHAHDRRERELGNVESTTVDDLTVEDRMITGIYLRVATREGANLSSSQGQVFSELRTLQPSLAITVSDPLKEVSKLFAIIDNLEMIFLAMAAVVMISSGIGILLALYNSMEQRRRQIAVLRVLGCSRGRVFGLVITESAMLGLVGAIAGVALAWLGAEAVGMVLNQRLGLVIDASLPIKITAVVGLATIALAAVAGLIPAFVAYRTPVVRNLRPLG